MPQVQPNKSPRDTIIFSATLPLEQTGILVITNHVTAESQGLTARSQASVQSPASGFTTLLKDSEQGVLPLDGGVARGTWDVTMTSHDASTSSWTDTIDILPHVGDGRGSAFSGSYRLSGPVSVPAGATVYYTTADPATLNEDPGHASNGTAPGSVAGNSVGWSTTYTPTATAVRVIGAELESGRSQEFSISIETSGAAPGDRYVNIATGRAHNTKMRMRTSSTLRIADEASLVLKKYVRDAAGEWQDAQVLETYPELGADAELRYRLVVKNTGTVDLSDVLVTDDKVDVSGMLSAGAATVNPAGGVHADRDGIRIETLPVGGEVTIEYALPADAPDVSRGVLVNTACAGSGSSDVAESCDPAGVRFVERPTTPQPSEPSQPTGPQPTGPQPTMPATGGQGTMLGLAGAFLALLAGAGMLGYRRRTRNR